MLSPERKAERKARRKFRHEIFKRMKRVAIRRCGLFCTGPQLDQMAKVFTDRYMHAVDNVPTRVEPIPESCPTPTS